MAATGQDGFAAKSTAFMAWLASQPNTYISPDIELADYRSRNAGRGLKARIDIPADTDLFTIPRPSILSVQTSDLPAKLPAVFAPDGGDPTAAPSPWTALILVLIYEYLRPTSPWQPYLDILPEHFDTLMFWSPAELAELRGCAVVDKIGRASADDEFRQSIVPIVQANKAVFCGDNIDNEKLSEENLMALAHRMGSTIMAYAFDIERDLDSASAVDEDGYATEDDEDTLPKGLVPLADMLNADAVPNASLFYGAHALTMKTLRPVARGAEIFNDYGQIPRSDLLRRYGYITPLYAPFDCVEVDMAAVVAAVKAHARTAVVEGELPKRLAWLDKQDLLETAYDLAWPAQGGDAFHMSPIMSCVVRTLLIDHAHYKVPAADPDGGHVPAADIRQVLKPVLEDRLAQYTGDLEGDAELIRNPAVQGRHRMAVEVRHGEMKLLQAALKSLKVDDDDSDDDAATAEEPQSKKRKVG